MAQVTSVYLKNTGNATAIEIDISAEVASDSPSNQKDDLGVIADRLIAYSGLSLGPHEMRDVCTYLDSVRHIEVALSYRDELGEFYTYFGRGDRLRRVS